MNPIIRHGPEIPELRAQLVERGALIAERTLYPASQCGRSGTSAGRRHGCFRGRRRCRSCPGRCWWRRNGWSVPACSEQSRAEANAHPVGVSLAGRLGARACGYRGDYG